ncbi:MAG: rRNA maturation RNase YbeY [Saprospiraceae bacterium]
MIIFHQEDVEFSFDQIVEFTKWIQAIVTNENCNLTQLTYIFCSDKYLHQLNVEYLDHDTLTDVITFPYAAPPQVEGDIFISTERIAENAATFQTSFLHELARVMIHGVLHLCGYGDKTESEQQTMRAKENAALQLTQQYNINL